MDKLKIDTDESSFTYLLSKGAIEHFHKCVISDWLFQGATARMRL